MQLEKNEKIQKELDMYQQKINLISNDTVKKECDLLLGQIIRGIQTIDKQHFNLSLGGNMNDLKEVRESLASARKRLDKRIKDSEQAGLITK
jgi:hypothetical protein